MGRRRKRIKVETIQVQLLLFCFMLLITVSMIFSPLSAFFYHSLIFSITKKKSQLFAFTPHFLEQIEQLRPGTDVQNNSTMGQFLIGMFHFFKPNSLIFSFFSDLHIWGSFILNAKVIGFVFKQMLVFSAVSFFFSFVVIDSRYFNTTRFLQKKKYISFIKKMIINYK